MNCSGCDEELMEAIDYQDDSGLYYATSIDREYYQNGHFIILMVDDDGEVIIS